jgi:uncharacterized membrane protein
VYLNLTRPKWSYTPLMKLVDVVCVLVLAGMFAYAWNAQTSLPELVPTHFGLNGNADHFGPRNTLYFLPFISLFTYLILVVARFDARIINIPVAITEKTAPSLFPIALQMVTLVQLILISFFGCMLYQTAQVALSRQPGLSIGVVAGFVIALVTVLVTYISRMRRLASGQATKA